MGTQATAAQAPQQVVQKPALSTKGTFVRVQVTFTYGQSERETTKTILVLGAKEGENFQLRIRASEWAYALAELKRSQNGFTFTNNGGGKATMISIVNENEWIPNDSGIFTFKGTPTQFKETLRVLFTVCEPAA